MDIAYNIKRLRSKNDMTQDELANLIGCSAKTVSKWECGDGYPDITFVPVIANVFGVTTDELFGVDELRKKERITEYVQRIMAVKPPAEYAGMDDYYKQMQEISDSKDTIVHEALREFAGDMSTEAYFAAFMSEQNNDKKIAVYQRVLERSTDDELRNTARNNLAYLLEQMGEIVRAIEIAEALPRASAGQTYLLPWLTRGHGLDGLKNMQTSIIELYQIISNIIGLMVNMRGENGEDIYCDADKARLCAADFAIKIAAEDGEIHGPLNIIGTCLNVARYSASAGLYEQAFEYLEKAAEYAERYDDSAKTRTYSGVMLTECPELVSPDRQMALKSSHPPMRGIVYNDMKKTFNAEHFAQLMGYASVDEIHAENAEYKRAFSYENAYDPIRNHPRFVAVLERVREK